jgi:hypothetical protein
VEGIEAGQLRASQQIPEMLAEITVAQAFDTRYAAGAGSTCFERRFHR